MTRSGHWTRAPEESPRAMAALSVICLLAAIGAAVAFGMGVTP